VFFYANDAGKQVGSINYEVRTRNPLILGILDKKRLFEKK